MWAGRRDGPYSRHGSGGSGVPGSNVGRGHREDFAPETVVLVAERALRARDELGRIRHVRCRVAVKIHSQRGVEGNEMPGGSGVVQMDVREEDVPEISDGQSPVLQRSRERVQAGRGPGIDEAWLGSLQ